MADLWRRARGTQELRLLLITLALAALLSVATPNFATMQNLLDLLTSTAFTGILATGLLVVLVAGGVDISFAATASITQYVGLTLANQGHVGWVGLVAVCLGLGVALGMINAVLVSTLNLSSIIVTIATQSLFYGLLMSATSGQDIFALPAWFNDGLHWVLWTDAAGNEQALNLQIVLLVSVLVVTWFLLTRTSTGRQVVAMGGNPEAARRIGFKVFRLNLLVYGFMGMVSALAGLAHAQMVQSVSPSALVGRELDVLAAVVLGGASLNGGIGSVSGAALGVALLAVLQNGMTLFGVSSYWSPLVTGGVIVVAVSTMARQRAGIEATSKGVGCMSRLGNPVFAAAQRLVGPVNLRLIGLLAALSLLFSMVAGEQMFSAGSLRSMAFQLPELGLLSLAMMIPLLSGGLDLSIIATANLSALAMAWVLTHMLPGATGAAWVMWQLVALVCGLLVAGGVGLLNGYLIAYRRVSPILATLGTMTLVKGLAVGLTHGGAISGFPETVLFIGHGTVGGVPAALLLFIVVAIPMGILLARSPLGLSVALIGSNEQATRYSGIDTQQVQMKVYVMSALLAAITGLVMMARFDSANAAYGESYLLITILAAVLGGVSPTGGFGRVSGLVLALVVLQLISTAASMMDLSQFLTLSIWGATLIGVAGTSALKTWWLRLRLTR